MSRVVKVFENEGTDTLLLMADDGWLYPFSLHLKEQIMEKVEWINPSIYCEIADDKYFGIDVEKDTPIWVRKEGE